MTLLSVFPQEYQSMKNQVERLGAQKIKYLSLDHSSKRTSMRPLSNPLHILLKQFNLDPGDHTLDSRFVVEMIHLSTYCI